MLILEYNMNQRVDDLHTLKEMFDNNIDVICLQRIKSREDLNIFNNYYISYIETTLGISILSKYKIISEEKIIFKSFDKNKSEISMVHAGIKCYLENNICVVNVLPTYGINFLSDFDEILQFTTDIKKNFQIIVCGDFHNNKTWKNSLIDNEFSKNNLIESSEKLENPVNFINNNCNGFLERIYLSKNLYNNLKNINFLLEFKNGHKPYIIEIDCNIPD